jgi:hypothetical protein
MNIAALQLDADVEVPTKDTLPPTGGFVLDTGLYPMVVDNAYMDKSSGGALNLNIHLKLAGGDKRIFRQTIYMTSGKAKGGKPFYMKDGKKYPLPGYIIANNIAQVTTDLPINQVTPEKKLVKLYDFEAKGEVAREVPVVTEMIGKELLVGMRKCRENKRVKSGDDWVDSPEAREFNEIDKVFDTDGFTVTERAAEADKASFVEQWKDAHPSDFVRDRFKVPAGGSGARSAAAPEAVAEAPADLFED